LGEALEIQPVARPPALLVGVNPLKERPPAVTRESARVTTEALPAVAVAFTVASVWDETMVAS